MSKLIILIISVVFSVQLVSAAEDQIASALSAAPDSLAKNATVADWDGTILRQGTNSWTCLPDIPDNGGADPWCVDASWQNLLNALTNDTEPTYDKLGIAYMLAGDSPVSNITPTGVEADGDWVMNLKAHLMILVPDHAMFDNISTDPSNGGPWIMWTNTPYAHIMVPIDSYPE